MTDFQSAFYRDVQLLPGGWTFFVANLYNSKCRYGERGAAAAGAVLEPLGGNCAVLP